MRIAAPILRDDEEFDWGQELLHWAETHQVGVLEIIDKHRLSAGWCQLRVRLAE